MNCCRTDIIIVQPQRKTGMFGHIAGTAAGVAAGTVIGDKITGRNESTPSYETTTVDPTHGPCKYEEEKVLNCVESQMDLQTCESYKKAFLDCKYKYSMNF